MSLQFRRAVENMDVWSASSADISFVYIRKSDRLRLSWASWLSCFVAPTVFEHRRGQGDRFTVQYIRGS
jgi:hypothetical protein